MIIVSGRLFFLLKLILVLLTKEGLVSGKSSNVNECNFLWVGFWFVGASGEVEVSWKKFFGQIADGHLITNSGTKNQTMR